MVAYDGTDFHGWQVQPGLRTVQGMLETAVGAVTGVAPPRLSGAGRTDAGVHARGQVASFESDSTIPALGLGRAMNTLLPGDVRVREAEEAPPGFHARHSARARRYAYRLLQEDDVLLHRIAWRPRRIPEREALEDAVQALAGCHDFSAFRATGGSDTSPRCRIDSIGWSEWEGGLRLDIEADHFLYHMVRNILGTALEVAAAPDPAGAMRAVLESRDRRKAGVTAPPHGLCLELVRFEEPPS